MRIVAVESLQHVEQVAGLHMMEFLSGYMTMLMRSDAKGMGIQ